MTYFSDIHTYLHQSSLLIQAYPHSTRITTKYSLPRKPKPSKKKSSEAETSAGDAAHAKTKKEPSATLTLKTYQPESGICLKYKTDKAAEVGRLMTGLGKLAKGELVDMPTGDTVDNTGAGIEIGSGQGLTGTDQMDVDGGAGVTEAKTAAQMTQGNQQQQGGGGKKKKKGKK